MFARNHPLLNAANTGAAMPNVGDFTEEEKLFYDMAQWIWAQYAGDHCYFSPQGTNHYNRRTGEDGSTYYSIEQLRAYSRGEQSIIPYQTILDPDRVKARNPNEARGLMNISWTPPSILPKIVSQLEGIYDPLRYDFRVNAADARAKKERELQRAKMRMSVSPEWQALEQEVGVPASNKTVMQGIVSPEDLDLMFRFGGDRLGTEIKMEAAIRGSLKQNDYPGTISEMIKRDAIDLGFVAAEVSIDAASGLPVVDYVDPANLIMPKSRYRDFRDAGYCGRVIKLKVHEFVRELTEQGYGQDEAEDMAARLAKQHAKVYVGNKQNLLQNEGYKDEDEIYVLRGWFIASNIQRYVTGPHRRTGAMVYTPVNRDSELRNRDYRDGKRLEDVPTQYVYRFSHVLGSSFIYDYGRDYAIARSGPDGQKVARLPIQCYRLDSPSIVARCIPIVDEMTMATYRKRDAITKVMPAPGLRIDLALVESEVEMGGQRVSFADLLGLAYKSGVLFYKSTDEALARGMLNGGASPVSEADSSKTVRTIEAFITEINTGLMEIRTVTGLNELQDNTARPDLLVGIARGLQSSTNNSLLHLLRAYQNISKQAVSYLVLKWQAMLHYGDVTLYDIPTSGGPSIEHIISQSDGEYDFVVTVETQPTDREREELVALATQQQQKEVLDLPEYLEFMRMVRHGNMSAATLFLALATDRNRRRIQANSERLQIMNAQVQQQSNAQAEQQKRETMQLEQQLAIDKRRQELIGELQKELTILRAKGEVQMVQQGIQDGMAAEQQMTGSPS